jgi:hypothetical protein
VAALTAPRVVAIHPVDAEHQVVSIEGGDGDRWRYRRRPCGGCPWRVDQTGSFPAGAFEASANTAYDMATSMFGCHEAGKDRPATCAGFLLRGADDNLAVRLKAARGAYDPSSVEDGGVELHESYRVMAVANGVPAEAEVLRECAR